MADHCGAAGQHVALGDETLGDHVIGRRTQLGGIDVLAGRHDHAVDGTGGATARTVRASRSPGVEDRAQSDVDADDVFSRRARR
jgi:hypothetical protein